jgi:hypothetical protein
LVPWSEEALLAAARSFVEPRVRLDRTATCPRSHLTGNERIEQRDIHDLRMSRLELVHTTSDQDQPVDPDADEAAVGAVLATLGRAFRELDPPQETSGGGFCVVRSPAQSGSRSSVGAFRRRSCSFVVSCGRRLQRNGFAVVALGLWVVR